MRARAEALTEQEKRQHRHSKHAFRDTFRSANQRQAKQCDKLAGITRKRHPPGAEARHVAYRQQSADEGKQQVKRQRNENGGEHRLDKEAGDDHRQAKRHGVVGKRRDDGQQRGERSAAQVDAAEQVQIV